MQELKLIKTAESAFKHPFLLRLTACNGFDTPPVWKLTFLSHSLIGNVQT